LSGPDSSAVQRIAEAWSVAMRDAATVQSVALRPLAIGWATVELDRAALELAAALGIRRDPPFFAAPRSAVLGGACRIATGALRDDGALVILEPDTESRLAGSLARFGEGPIAVWLAVADTEAAQEGLRREGLALAAAQEGPFGPERLVLDGSADQPAHRAGRHRLLVARAAGTIQP
jgi:hypothetical protein